MSVTVYACASCGLSCFPARQICHRCGGAEWTAFPVAGGRVEETTTVRHQADAAATGAVHLASVRTAGGVLIMARLDRAVERGGAVRLALAPDGAILGVSA